MDISRSLKTPLCIGCCGQMADKGSENPTQRSQNGNEPKTDVKTCSNFLYIILHYIYIHLYVHTALDPYDVYYFSLRGFPSYEKVCVRLRGSPAVCSTRYVNTLKVTKTADFWPLSFSITLSHGFSYRICTRTYPKYDYGWLVFQITRTRYGKRLSSTCVRINTGYHISSE
jgi:hypothetical protein